MRKVLLVVTVVLGMAGDPADACAFHTMLPAETVADKLLAADTVLLARPDPDDPFRFRPVEALRGVAPDALLPQLVDAQARAFFAASGAPRAALFVRLDAYGPWDRLALLDDRSEPVIREIVAASERWLYEGDAVRGAYFAKLLGTGDRLLDRLALRELDRLPYALLRQLAADIDPAAIPQGPGREPGLRAIRTLLVGLSPHPGAAAALRARLADPGSGWLGAELGALAVAVMEADGAEGVARLVDRLREDPDLAPTDRELVVEAMAIQRAEGRPELAPLIEAALAGLVQDQPELAPAVARQLGVRADFSQAAALRDAMRSGALTKAGDLIAVSSYISLATQTPDTSGD